MSTRRTTRDTRNGDTDGRVHHNHKETMLDAVPSNTDSTATSPTCPSPGRMTTTGKIKSFFKRRPREQEQHKQLSSFGSSSQLRTPPTSDPGRSLNSDD
jgi:3',5'-cyclic-nucleotide phosphodiesterase